MRFGEVFSFFSLKRIFGVSEVFRLLESLGSFPFCVFLL